MQNSSHLGRVRSSPSLDHILPAKTTGGTFVSPARGGDAGEWKASGRWRNAELVPVHEKGAQTGDDTLCGAQVRSTA